MSTGQKNAAENPCETKFFPAMASVYIEDVAVITGKIYSSPEEMEEHIAEDFKHCVTELVIKVKRLRAKLEQLEKEMG